jgi:FMN-dependent NADH-azoreductase
MMKNRYEYIGSLDQIFNHDGLSVQYGNPYDTKEGFLESLQEYCDEFLVEHLLNNVLLPSYNINITSMSKSYYDSRYDAWVLYTDDVYYVFV